MHASVGPSVHPFVLASRKFVNTISSKLFEGISPNLHVAALGDWILIYRRLDFEVLRVEFCVVDTWDCNVVGICIILCVFKHYIRINDSYYQYCFLWSWLCVATYICICRALSTDLRHRPS